MISKSYTKYLMTRGEAVNRRPFQHIAPHGTMLVADRCDFKNGAQLVLRDPRLPRERLVEDIVSSIDHHIEHVRPHLKDFGGYGSVKFTVIRKS